MNNEKMESNFATHTTYNNQDKNIPDTICDRNGQVVLFLCKKCGGGEIDLINFSCDEYKDKIK